MKKILLLILLISSVCYAKIRVLEIDTGVSKNSHSEIDNHLPKNVINILDFLDYNGHGTHVAGLILNNTCSQVELESCSWFGIDNPKGNWNDYMNCLRLAVLNHPDFVNISSGGPNYEQEEYNLLMMLSSLGTKIIVAAGNNGQDLNKFDYYPAKYKIPNLIPVGSLLPDGSRSRTSNFGLKNEVYELGFEVMSTLPNGLYGKMSGTSQATANYTNRLLKVKCNGR